MLFETVREFLEQPGVVLMRGQLRVYKKVVVFRSSIGTPTKPRRQLFVEEAPISKKFYYMVL